MKSLFLSLALAGSVAHAADISLERITSDPPLQGSVPRHAPAPTQHVVVHL